MFLGLRGVGGAKGWKGSVTIRLYLQLFPSDKDAFLHLLSTLVPIALNITVVLSLFQGAAFPWAPQAGFLFMTKSSKSLISLRSQHSVLMSSFPKERWFSCFTWVHCGENKMTIRRIFSDYGSLHNNTTCLCNSTPEWPAPGISILGCL